MSVHTACNAGTSTYTINVIWRKKVQTEQTRATTGTLYTRAPLAVVHGRLYLLLGIRCRYGARRIYGDYITIMILQSSVLLFLLSESLLPHTDSRVGGAKTYVHVMYKVIF